MVLEHTTAWFDFLHAQLSDVMHVHGAELSVPQGSGVIGKGLQFKFILKAKEATPRDESLAPVVKVKLTDTTAPQRVQLVKKGDKYHAVFQVPWPNSTDKGKVESEISDLFLLNNSGSEDKVKSLNVAPINVVINAVRSHSRNVGGRGVTFQVIKSSDGKKAFFVKCVFTKPHDSRHGVHTETESLTDSFDSELGSDEISTIPGRVIEIEGIPKISSYRTRQGASFDVHEITIPLPKSSEHSNAFELLARKSRLETLRGHLRLKGITFKQEEYSSRPMRARL